MANCSAARMLTPKLRVAVIARALVPSEPSETRTVGGSADTEAKAVTVIPHGLSPTQQVTSTTPLASALIASANSGICADSDAGSVTSFRSGSMRCPPGTGGWWALGGGHQPLPSCSRSRHVHRDRDAVADHV